MGTIRRIGKSWRAEIRRRGFYRSENFAVKAAALAWMREVEEEFLAGTRGRPVTQTMGDAFRRFRLEVSPSRRGARWETLRLAALEQDPLSLVPIAEIDAPDLAAWRDRRLQSVQGSTVLRESNLIRSVLTLARAEWGWTKRNPFETVTMPPGNRHRRRRVSEAEIQAVLRALGYAEGAEIVRQQQRVAIAFLVALETGMRAGEILSLDARDVFLPERFVRLDLTKNGDARDVPLTGRAVELLQRMPTDGRLFPVSSGTLDVLFRRAVKDARIEGLTFHDSRHEACTRLARKLNVLELAKMIGHRDPKSLMIYFNPTASEIAEKL